MAASVLEEQASLSVNYFLFSGIEPMSHFIQFGNLKKLLGL